MTFKKLEKRVHKDYTDNFLPRTEIKLSLNSEEIFILLENKKFQQDIALTWRLKFYSKQLFITSVEKMEEPVRNEFLKEMLIKTKNILSAFSTREKKSILAMLQLKFCIKTISDFDLCDLFRGASHFDDWCAQVAYARILTT